MANPVLFLPFYLTNSLFTKNMLHYILGDFLFIRWRDTMGVRPEQTPNPNAMKYTTNTILFEGTDSISVLPGDVSEHEILNDLMKIDGVDNVFGYQNFITVTKFFDVEWDDINDQILDVFKKHGIE